MDFQRGVLTNINVHCTFYYQDLACKMARIRSGKLYATFRVPNLHLLYGTVTINVGETKCIVSVKDKMGKDVVKRAHDDEETTSKRLKLELDAAVKENIRVKQENHQD